MKRFAFCILFALCTVSLSAQPIQDAHSRCRPGVWKFQGEVRRGQTFSHTFGEFVFALVPEQYGWTIDISQGEQHFLDGLTGPAHFVPNPIDIEGWHFRNAANTGPNTGDVNAPQETRRFLFSPRWPHCHDAEGLDKDGQGTLQITDMKLGNLVPGTKANILMMKFTVKLTVNRPACTSCPPGRQRASVARPNLELQIVPGKLDRGLPEEFTFVFVNISSHQLRMPRPTQCSGGNGTVLLRSQFAPLNPRRVPSGGGGGCGAGHSAEQPILQRAKSWESLKPGESLAVHYSRRELFDFHEDAGTYEFWVEYLPPQLSIEDVDLVESEGFGFPRTPLASTHLHFTRPQ